MTAPNRSTLWAGVLMEELARHGVREVVVAPGSRSTPLMLAAARRPGVRVLTEFDERSAGFLALGIGRARGYPAAVVTTSGTAVANLLPATVEASQAGVPLLVVSADRPGSLRGTDANQTIDQVRMFGGYARAFLDAGTAEPAGPALRRLRGLAARAVAAAMGPPAGPVQINVPLAKPLEPTPGEDGVPEDLAAAHPLAAAGRPAAAPYTAVHAPRAVPDGALRLVREAVAGAARGLIVAGPLPDPEAAGPALVALARATGFPLLADPLSGGRCAVGAAAAAVPGYDAFLEDPGLWDRLRPDLVLRFGPAPTSVALQHFLEDCGSSRQVVIDDGARWPDALAAATDMVRAPAAPLARRLAEGAPAPPPGPWRARWHALGRAAQDALEGALAEESVEAGATVAAAGAAAEHGAPVFVGNSMPIRDLDRYLAPQDAPCLIAGNRGASGIDGLVSTALGLSVGLNRKPVALLGDLSFLHDANGLFATRDAGAAAVFVVLHNDGGGIFHLLPIRRHEPEFTRHVVVPHGIDLARVAAVYDLPHRALPVDGDVRGAVGEALARTGTTIIEVRTDRVANARRHAAALAAVRDAVRAQAGEDA